MTWFTQYGKSMDEFIQHVESPTPTPSEFNLGFHIKIALAMNPTSLSIPQSIAQLISGKQSPQLNISSGSIYSPPPPL